MRITYELGREERFGKKEQKNKQQKERTTF